MVTAVISDLLPCQRIYGVRKAYAYRCLKVASLSRRLEVTRHFASSEQSSPRYECVSSSTQPLLGPVFLRPGLSGQPADPVT